MPQQTLISVRVTTRAPRDEVVGWRDDVLQVRLRALPVEGRANEALRRLLADRLGLTLAQVDIVSGGSSRNKLLRIDGLTEAELKERLTDSRR